MLRCLTVNTRNTTCNVLNICVGLQGGYDGYGYGESGDGNGVGGYGGGMNEAQLYEESILQLRRNNKIQRASHLARGADFMLAEVLDDCSHCGQIQTMVRKPYEEIILNLVDSLLN